MKPKLDLNNPDLVEHNRRLLRKLRDEEIERRQKAYDKLPCRARTRKGTPCKAKREPGRKRCRRHGGLSTGPKTFLGKLIVHMNLPNPTAHLEPSDGKPASKQRKQPCRGR